ncbi:MAG TPA: sn-glycerol-3-phosphate ABC transporter ATP-binding protein UgpC [Dyella sp.]|uniref:ABC transporter ATP-binding protein n=1 Tax=Dyella sp. TaxID=1869338 RepID=UPI002F952CA5
MSTIEFKQVSKRFSHGLPLTINKVDLRIEQGEFCAFVGPSGCGKSTLLRMVAGLEEITSGDLLIGDQRVNDIAPAKRGVAMVFQSYALYPHMTVYENMAFGLRTIGADKVAIDKKVREAAQILQLTPLLDRLPKALSGGQRQRVAIGRAIVKQPRVFLFDEPLSNLDASLRVQTRLEIAKLHREMASSSMIYVTHDQVEAMTLAQKVVLLNTGPRIEEQLSIAQVGTPMDLYHRPRSRFVAEFIGSPRINLLPARLLRANPASATFEVLGQEVEAAVDATHLPARANVLVGIRPEHVVVAESGEGALMRGSVTHVERLGDATLLYLSLGGALAVTVRVEGDASRAVGQQIQIQLLREALHVFDDHGNACPRTPQLPH